MPIGLPALISQSSAQAVDASTNSVASQSEDATYQVGANVDGQEILYKIDPDSDPDRSAPIEAKAEVRNTIDYEYEADSEASKVYGGSTSSDESSCVDEGLDERLNWGVDGNGAGCWLLVAGCWLLVAGCWVNGHRTRADCVESGEWGVYECPDGTRLDTAMG